MRGGVFFFRGPLYFFHPLAVFFQMTGATRARVRGNGGANPEAPAPGNSGQASGRAGMAAWAGQRAGGWTGPGTGRQAGGHGDRRVGRRARAGQDGRTRDEQHIGDGCHDGARRASSKARRQQRRHTGASMMQVNEGKGAGVVGDYLYIYQSLTETARVASLAWRQYR